MFDGVLEVKASSGDNKLGGKDFDQAIIDWLKSGIKDEYGIDTGKDHYAEMKLKDAAESAKIRLSKEDQVHITIPLLRPHSFKGNV